MAELVIERLSKIYGSVKAVDNISLTVADGEFVTLLGPSGCGKSTTLQSIAGLEQPTAGRIRVGDAVFVDSERGINLPPEERNCGLVFQSYALWPHMTVAENLAFPLKLRKVGRTARARRIADALGLVEMRDHGDRYPHQLSGGQQQRVALARTLVYEPTILLLDEPLSNLDAKLRERARVWLCALQRRLGVTTVYVTHDQVEALDMSDRIAVMDGGRISQMASPKEVYERPADQFVADFVGTTNFLRGEVVNSDVEAGFAAIRLSDGQVLTSRVGEPMPADTRVVVVVRPEKIQLHASAAEVREEKGSLLQVKIMSRSYFGARFQYHLSLGTDVVKAESHDEFASSEAWIRIPCDCSQVFVDRGGTSARATF